MGSFIIRAKKHPKATAITILIVVSCVILHMFSVWQLDLIVCWPVWSNVDDVISRYQQMKNAGLNRYADAYFQCWIWKTNIGWAYDVLFFLNFLSFYIVIIVLITYFYWLMKGERR